MYIALNMVKHKQLSVCMYYSSPHLVVCVSLVYVPVHQIGEEVDALAQVYEGILLFG